MTNKYVAYTDGSALNTGSRHPGGSSYIIFDSNGQEIKRRSKGFKHTTSNRMEILAIMSVVNSLPKNSFVTIHSDSKYSINVLSGKWRARENLDQITRYRTICTANNIEVKFVWVRGHRGNPYNELCDKMAREEYKKSKGRSRKKRSKKTSQTK